MNRYAEKKRITKETNIRMSIDLDGNGKSEISTGIGFFDHMLTLFAFYSKVNLKVEANGDLYVCDHHLVEDCGIVLGTIVSEALQDKKGIARYGNARIPMDESLCQIDLDLSGRNYLVYNCELKREKVGDFSCEMVKEFLYAFASNAKLTLHVNVLYGDNDHHKIEAIFKALGSALRKAIRIESDEITSTKGML